MRETGWRDSASYGHFLQVQHAARLPLENWAEHACPSDIRPPRQTHLIERDLAALDMNPFAAPPAFAMPEGADPIGYAWAIAGSSLGNRAILHDIERRGADSDRASAMPSAFLADPEMAVFWKSLRPALELPATQGEAGDAARAATAVFDHFRKTASAFAPAEVAA